MNSSHNNGPQNIAASIALAFIIHLLVIATIRHLPSLNEQEERTVPIVVISNSGTVRRANSQASTSKTQQRLISTISNQNIKTLRAEQNKERRASTSKKGDSPSLPSAAQSHRQRKSREGITTLFAQTGIGQQNAPSNQVSSRQAPPLSKYQTQLIQHMLRGELYDKFHQILRDNNKPALNYTLNLRLLPNGAIKGASIKTSSGIVELDKLAITAAYNASPFPRPPNKDSAIRFQYDIPVRYQP